ncbi:MAG: FAD-dependent oxidoreductase [Proteobacteria bacterium]|nr:FAD-dependent oxidoreductase [Pseudomonadota bacterium]
MSLNVVIIGAVALGPKTACRLKRLLPEARVALIDRDALISYGGCGIPYYISGDVSEASQLQSTSFHMVRDPHFFRQAKDVEVLARTEALSIDRQAKTVRVRALDTGEERDLPYDKLVLATGSRANRLPVPGADQARVFTVSNLEEAIRIKELIAGGQVERPVVIGGGAIGLEMVEALSDLWGLETTLVEVQDQLLPGIVGPNMARMVKEHLHEHDVADVFLSERVERIEGQGAELRLVTDKRTIETDLIVMAVGVRPNIDLARAAGLEIGPTGAIAVDSRFRTSDPDILAGGDCVETMHLITGCKCYFPSGSLANRQGRIIGTNLAGAVEEFDGVVGSFILKIFDLNAASAGLCLSRARAEGFDAFSAFVVQGDRAHFYPGMDLMYLELVVERPTGRVLGIQGLSGQGDALAARIDAVAVLLKHAPTVRDVSNLELAYAPPFSAAMDVLNALGNTAENIMAGKNRIMDVDEFAGLFEQGPNGDFICLDVRGPANAEPFVRKHPGLWINIPQDELRDRAGEVPADKELILICNSGVRSYEAQVSLDHLGLGPSRNLQGGMAAIKKYGLKLD